MANYVLYKKDSCPFCQKVFRFLKENQIELEMKDIIENPAYKEELIQQGGKNQVPCLFIDGKPLYESDDIITYLSEHLLGEKKTSSSEEEPGVCPF